MAKRSNKPAGDPHERKRFVFASARRVDRLSKVAERFMLDVFQLERGDYLISDESTLIDFADGRSSDTSSIWNRIDELYALSKDDVRSERLVDIFASLSTFKRWS
jgi:hypothetical protein